MIVCFNYVHVQQRDYFVLVHILDHVYLLNEKFQSRFVITMFSFIHLID